MFYVQLRTANYHPSTNPMQDTYVNKTLSPKTRRYGIPRPVNVGASLLEFDIKDPERILSPYSGVGIFRRHTSAGTDM
jgi:hypothetical protein